MGDPGPSSLHVLQAEQHMRIRIIIAALSVAAFPVAAQEAAAPPASVLSPSGGLMVWTLVIFVVLMIVLTRFAFKPLTAAVEARERALQDAIDAARRDREEAAKLLAEQQRQIEEARNEAQRYIAEGRQAGEKMRADMLEHTRQEQQQLLERARQEISAERDRAIADLRREAVDLALLGASKVIEKNLDDQTNRRLVESFLSSVATDGRSSR
jgi:F-type H+-transporting ATPase subunit b